MKSRLSIGLSVVWLILTFVPLWFAREWDALLGGWPIAYWWGAQGLLLVYLVILFVHNRAPQSTVVAAGFHWRRRSTLDSGVLGFEPFRLHTARLNSLFRWYLFGLLIFIIMMASLEEAGLNRQWIGVLFLFASITLYAVIAVVCRTTNMAAYYVANRRIPPLYNGMASAADWMSAATFVSLAGGLYLQGFSGSSAAPGGLAYVLGWTGGFVLIGIWLAPQLRRLRLYTLPDFFRVRFGATSNTPLYMAILGTVLCSFTYLVAQIYGVGLITSRLTGVQFEIGIMLGLGGVLTCSFLGGMRAVTWTQVAQYVILLVAFLIPTSWLAYKQMDNPLAFASYPKQLQQIQTLEQRLMNSPTEKEVQSLYRQRVDLLQSKIDAPAKALTQERERLEERLKVLRESGGSLSEIQATRRSLALLATDPQQAQQTWLAQQRYAQAHATPLAGLPPHAQAYPSLLERQTMLPSTTQRTRDQTQAEQAHHKRLNFIALIVCLVAGTMGLPHVLTRFYTTPTVSGARKSVAWTLFFVTLIYLSVPAMATLVKYEVMTKIIGLSYDALPAWMRFWSQIDSNLLSFEDINRDGILQFSELHLGNDVLVLAAPELGGLPFFVSGLIAAGGLAAALSTADGLLLSIGNAFAFDSKTRHSQIGDVADSAAYQATEYRNAQNAWRQLDVRKRVLSSKLALLVVALLASALASFKPANILELVSASFSFAAAIFTPALLFGLYSKHLSARACSLAMCSGLVVTLAYMLGNSAWASALTGLPSNSLLIAGIHPSAAGVLGMAASVSVMLVSLIKERALRSVV